MPFLRHHLLLFTFFFYCSHLLLAQSDSVSKYKYSTTFGTNESINRNEAWEYLDTVSSKNEIFHPMFRNHVAFQDLGNIGMPGRSAIFGFTRATRFQFGFNPYQTYFKTPETAKYYDTKTPYADFTYAQGAKNLLFLDVTFALNLTPRLNFGVNFTRITSSGFYLRQYTSSYHTQPFLSYQSKTKRYAFYANANWNRGIHDENGGITSDSLFETLSGGNKSVPVNFSYSQSRYKNNIAFARQYYYLGSKKTVMTDDDTTVLILQKAFISHTLRFENNRYFFDNKGDTNALLFPGQYYDSTTVFSDSVQSKTLDNRIGIGFWNVAKKQGNADLIEFGITHQYIHTIEHELNVTFQNLILDALAERKPKKETDIGIFLNGNYCVTGYNSGDFQVKGQLKFVVKAFEMEGGLANYYFRPDFNLMHFRSNGYIWDNDFAKTNVLNTHFGISTRHFRNNLHLNLNQYLLDQWVYSGYQIAPEQTAQQIIVQSVDLNKTFRVGKFWFSNKIVYQKANSPLIHIPELSLNLRYFVAGSAFKKALIFQAGVDVFYNSAYYGNAYNSMTRTFYLQDQRLIGNYPLIDLFVTGEIRHAIIFAKYEHMNMDYIKSGYYYTPGYPLPIKAFRLGVRWRMYN